MESRCYRQLSRSPRSLSMLVVLRVAKFATLNAGLLIPVYLDSRSNLNESMADLLQDIFKYGCLYDVKAKITGTANSSILEVLEDKSASTYVSRHATSHTALLTNVTQDTIPGLQTPYPRTCPTNAQQNSHPSHQAELRRLDRGS
jgi:hypothetical protein